VFASSPHNFLLQQASGNTESYTLVFSTVLRSLTFTRCAVGCNAATPSWTATAYAGANAVNSAECVVSTATRANRRRLIR